MDHRWDEMLQAEHRRRAEAARFPQHAIEDDPEVERREQLERARERALTNRSPWEIGAAHWDQRDLYTTGSRIDDAGYGRGPSVHPEVGSYAYPRDESPPASVRGASVGPSLHEREAWPWLNYERVEPVPSSQGGGWRRADDAIHEDVREALAWDEALDATDIEVEVKDSEVTLTGTVRDRSSKRRAEFLAEHVRSVHDVHNRLTIRKEDDDLTFTSPIPAF